MTTPRHISPAPDSSAVPDRQSVDHVFARLRGAVLSGELRPGQEIPQAQLARDLDVSRTPMREALRMLHHEGLVELQTNRRPVVAPLSAEDFEELYLLRISLESSAMALTIPLLAPEEVATLEGLRAQMEHFADEQDADRWEVPHRAFQATLMSRAGQRTTSLLSELSDHSERYRRLIITRDPETWALLKSDHRQLMERVKQGDGDATADLRVGHLMRTASRLIPVLDSTYSFDRLKALHHRLTTTRWTSDAPAPRT